MKWHKIKHLSALLQIDIFMQYTVFHYFCGPNMDLQDRQCTYNIILRDVFVTIVAMEEQ